MKNYYTVYSTTNGELESFEQIRFAQSYIHNLKKMNKKNNIVEIFYIVEEVK